TRPSCPRSASARHSWSVCHPCRAERIATRTPSVGLLPQQHRNAAGGEVRDVAGDRLEPCGGHTLVPRLLRVPTQICFPVDRRRFAVGRGREPHEVGACEPDLLRMRRDERPVLLRVILLERRRVLRLVVQHDHGPPHSSGRGRPCRSLRLGPGARGREGESGKHGEVLRRTRHVELLIEVHVSSNDARNTSGFTWPAWYVFPLALLVSHTSAGLKSSGSIL